MIGLLVISHCNLGKEFLSAAELILGGIESAEYMSIAPAMDHQMAIADIKCKINRLNTGDGVLVMTDMFGGTPSNLSLSFLDSNNVEVISGVNLPMVVAVAQIRDTVKSLGELSEIAEHAGKRSITIAGKILKGNQNL